jgi:uncharacterized protein (DUF58 family)
MPSLLSTSEAKARSGSLGAAGAARFLDPAALMRIKNLEMRSKVIVEGFLTGLHRSPYHGFSVEFSEYRQYTPGDDPRYVDWKLYARTDRFFLKRFREETNLRCSLLLDLSKSMSYGSNSGAMTKAEYAKTCAATIAYFLWLQRDAVGLVTFDNAIGDVLPPRYRTGHLHRLMMLLERAEGGQSTDLIAPLEQVAKTSPRRGIIVLISDVLAPVEAVKTRMGYLRSQGHDVIVLRVLDPTEIEFDFKKESLFEDLETGRQLYVDPKSIREGYLQKFEAHSAELRRACDGLGVDLVNLRTDQPLELALFDFLSARARRGKFVARRGAASSGSQSNPGAA